MHEEAASQPSVADPCVRCGYELAGVDDHTPCPECSLPAFVSRNSKGLSFADTDYLRRIRSGSCIVGLGVVCSVLSWIFGIAYTSSAASGSVNAIVSYFASMVSTLGWWLLVARDPSGVSERDFRFKTAFRVLLTISLIGESGELIYALIPNLRPVLYPFGFGRLAAGGGGILTTITHGTWIVADLCRTFVSMLFLRELFRALGNAVWSRVCAHLLWINPLLWTVFTLCFFIGPVVATVLTLITLVQLYITVNKVIAAQKQEQSNITNTSLS